MPIDLTGTIQVAVKIRAFPFSVLPSKKPCNITTSREYRLLGGNPDTSARRWYVAS